MDIVGADEDDEADEDNKPDQVDHTLPFRGNPLAAADPLDGDEQKASAVEHRDGKDVEDGKVDAQENGQDQPPVEALPVG